MSLERFDVVIKDGEGKIVATIGRNLTEEKAEKRMLTGLSRINDRHFVDMIPAQEVGK